MFTMDIHEQGIYQNVLAHLRIRGLPGSRQYSLWLTKANLQKEVHPLRYTRSTSLRTSYILFT